MFKLFDLKDLRYVVLILIGLYGMHLYKTNQYLKEDNKRVAENYKQQTRLDSLRYAQKKLSKQEIQDYLNYQNKDLKQKLINSNVKLSRIEKIINQKFSFNDTIHKRKSVSPIIQSVRNYKPLSIPFIDKGKCLTIGGEIQYDGKDSLHLSIDKREFKGEFNYIASWERKPHRWFFGIKTRLFGKKIPKVTITNTCGESKTLIIDKTK